MKSYLTPIQVWLRTGIAKATLAKWRKDGEGPTFVKRGGRIEYPSRELEAWLQARRSKAKPARCGDLGRVDSEPKAAEQCPEREGLLREWIECRKTVQKLKDEQLTAFRTADPSLSTFAERIRLATATDAEAFRAYYRHVDKHGCV